MDSGRHSTCYIIFKLLVCNEFSGTVSAKGRSDDGKFNARSSYGVPVDISLIGGYVNALVGNHFTVLDIGHNAVDIGLEILLLKGCKLKISVNINEIEGSLAYNYDLIGIERSEAGDA